MIFPPPTCKHVLLYRLDYVLPIYMVDVLTQHVTAFGDRAFRRWLKQAETDDFVRKRKNLYPSLLNPLPSHQVKTKSPHQNPLALNFHSPALGKHFFRHEFHELPSWNLKHWKRKKQAMVRKQAKNSKSAAQIYLSFWSDTKKQNILPSINLVSYNIVKETQPKELWR